MNFKQSKPTTPVSPRALYQSHLNTAASDLILFSALTLVNIVLVFTQANVSFSFSAFLPDFLVVLGLGIEAATGNNLPLILFGVVAVAFVAGCVVSALLTKKHPGWLTLGTVLVCIDTAILAYTLVLNMSIIDSFIWYILFHIWILFNLFRGHSAINKLKNLPLEPQTYDVPFTEVSADSENSDASAANKLNGEDLPPNDGDTV